MTQAKALFAQAAKLGVLGNSLLVFLEARELLQRICDCVSGTHALRTSAIDVAMNNSLFCLRAYRHYI